MQALVIREHPKLVNKWALRYITMYRTKGPEEAKKWALEFLPAPERNKMIERVNQILSKKRNR